MNVTYFTNLYYLYELQEMVDNYHPACGFTLDVLKSAILDRLADKAAAQMAFYYHCLELEQMFSCYFVGRLDV